MQIITNEDYIPSENIHIFVFKGFKLTKSLTILLNPIRNYHGIQIIFQNMDFSLIKDFSHAFENMNCSVSGLDTSECTDMSYMFMNSSVKLLNNIRTEKVIDMSNMFYNAEINNINFSTFNSKSLKRCECMFSKCKENVLYDKLIGLKDFWIYITDGSWNIRFNGRNINELTDIYGYIRNDVKYRENLSFIEIIDELCLYFTYGRISDNLIQLNILKINEYYKSKFGVDCKCLDISEINNALNIDMYKGLTCLKMFYRLLCDLRWLNLTIEEFKSYLP